MHLTLRQKNYVTVAVFAAGLLLMLLCDESMLFLLLGVAVGLGAVALNVAWWRCPHCGSSLGRSYGEYCSHCGKVIDYDAKR